MFHVYTVFWLLCTLWCDHHKFSFRLHRWPLLHIMPCPYTSFPLMTIRGKDHSSHLFSIAMCLFVYFVFFFYVSHMSEIIEYLSFYPWLISLRVMSSRSVVAHRTISSFYAEEHSIVCVCIISSLSICLSMGI